MIRKLLLAVGVVVLIGVGIAAWWLYALTQPEIWTRDLGGGWKLEQRRYASSHGTNFGVLFREERGRRREFAELVYNARYYPSSDCVAYGTTSGRPQILAICGDRRALLVGNASDWDIGADGISHPGEPPITPERMRQLTLARR